MVVKKGYKKTEIGEIPIDWCVDRLGNVCQIFGRIGYRGYTVNDIVANGCGAIALSPSNIIENRIDYSNCTFISWFKYEESPEIKIFNGDILLVKTGSTYGKVCYVENLIDKATINPQIVVLKKVTIDKKYLFYLMCFRSFQNQISAAIVGGAIPTLSQELVSNFTISLPPTKQEQAAIAQVLSDTDGLISSLEKLIEKKKQIKQGVMQQLLTGKKRLPGFSGKWEVKRLGEIAFLGRGRVISQKEIDRSIEKKYPVYSSQTSDNGVMGYIDTYDFNGEYLTWTTDGVNAGKVFYRNGKFNCTNVCGTIKLKYDHHPFIAYLLDTLTSRYVSKNLANPKLMNDVVKKIILPLPQVEEQIAIANIIDELETEISILEQKLNKYKSIKQGMMENLLTGKIRLV